MIEIPEKVMFQVNLLNCLKEKKSQFNSEVGSCISKQAGNRS